MVSESKVRVISLLGMLFKADLIGVCVYVWVAGGSFTHSCMQTYTLLERRWENKSQPAALRGLLSPWHLWAPGVRALMCLNKKKRFPSFFKRRFKSQTPWTRSEEGFFIHPKWFHPYSVAHKKKEKKKKLQHALRSSQPKRNVNGLNEPLLLPWHARPSDLE